MILLWLSWCFQILWWYREVLFSYQVIYYSFKLETTECWCVGIDVTCQTVRRLNVRGLLPKYVAVLACVNELWLTINTAALSYFIYTFWPWNNSTVYGELCCILLEIMCFRLSFNLSISFCTRFSVFLSPFISSSFPYQPCTIHMANIMTVLYSLHQNCSQHNTDSSKQWYHAPHITDSPSLLILHRLQLLLYMSVQSWMIPPLMESRPQTTTYVPAMGT